MGPIYLTSQGRCGAIGAAYLFYDAVHVVEQVRGYRDITLLFSCIFKMVRVLAHFHQTLDPPNLMDKHVAAIVV